MLKVPLIIVSLFITSSALAALLTEREELILSLNQLTQIEASLHRAQQSAKIGINERYYFDYPRFHGDIPPCAAELNITSPQLALNREIRRRWSGNTVRRKPRHAPRTNQRLPAAVGGLGTK